MRYFREVKLSYILLLNGILGLLFGRFFLQALCLLLHIGTKAGIFWRVLGLQYGMLIFVVVFFINEFLYKRKRVPQPPSKEDLPVLYARLGLTILVFALGATAINLLFLL